MKNINNYIEKRICNKFAYIIYKKIGRNDMLYIRNSMVTHIVQREININLLKS